MTGSTTEITKKVDLLRLVHLRALASFNVLEELLKYRAPNILGDELAHKHALAIGAYAGFFNSVEEALRTQLHLTVSKLYDHHKDGLSLNKLLNYVEQNPTQYTLQQRAKDTGQYTKKALLQVRHELENAEITLLRLKAVRDKEVVHNDQDGLLESDYLSYQEYSDLIELSERVLNLVSSSSYSNAANFPPYVDQVIEDTHKLLRLVSKGEEITESQQTKA